MEYPAKMMSQHFTSMLEHLKVSSLINKTRNSNQASSSSTNNTPSNEKELNSIDQTDSSSSSPILNNRSNVIVIQNHSDGAICEKLQSNSNNLSGINVNCNNQVQANGTKVKEINNIGTVSKCNDISNTHRQVTNNISCVKSNNPVLGIEIFPPPTNCISIGNSGCPIMGLQQHPQQQQRKQSFVIKPIKLKNVITQAETYDTLYTRATEVSNKKN